MNRLQFEPPSVTSLPQPSLQVASAEFAETGQCEVNHVTFAPLHYERNYAYPLIVWLHGEGDDERQLLRAMPLVSMRNYVGVAPRGSRNGDADSIGYCWRQDEHGIARAEHCVLECIEQATAKYNIDRSRVFLAGYDSGGTMALRVAMNQPHWIAGVLSIGGPFPREHNPLRFLEESRLVPLFLANGRDACNYDTERTCDDMRLLHTAGFSVTLRQYPCGDELMPQMLHDMNHWIMEQVTGTDSTDSSAVSPRHGEFE